MWCTPAVWKQYNKMAVLHFFFTKFPSNKYSILFVIKSPTTVCQNVTNLSNIFDIGDLASNIWNSQYSEENILRKNSEFSKGFHFLKNYPPPPLKIVFFKDVWSAKHLLRKMNDFKKYNCKFCVKISKRMKSNNVLLNRLLLNHSTVFNFWSNFLKYWFPKYWFSELVFSSLYNLFGNSFVYFLYGINPIPIGLYFVPHVWY